MRDWDASLCADVKKDSVMVGHHKLSLQEGTKLAVWCTPDVSERVGTNPREQRCTTPRPA